MKRPMWVLVALFVVSLPAVTTRLYASDEIEYFSFLRSLWFDRDISFENEYRYFYDSGIARGALFRETFIDLATPTGLRNNFGTIGSALLWMPMYAVADVGVRAARVMGATVKADGYSRPYIAAVTYGSALYGFLAVLMSAFIARRLFGEHIPAEWASAFVWFGTPLPFYMYLAPGMSHACSAFAVAAFVMVWLRVRTRWSLQGLAALGALAALMTMVREQDAFFAAGPAVDFIWTIADELRQGKTAVALARLKAAVVGGVAFAVCFIPQAWAYLVLNGRLGPATYIAAKMRWYSPHALQVLFSPEHGFFVWTPLAFVCVAGLLVAAKATHGELRRIVICLFIMFAAQVYVSGSVDTWTVAGSFGQRRFLGASALLVVGLVGGLVGLRREARGWRHTALSLVIALSIWWNLGLMAQFGANQMDRQRLNLPVNVYNTFVRVPLELPSLAYRYVFDRSSFYQHGPR